MRTTVTTSSKKIEYVTHHFYKQPRICLRGRLQGPLGRNSLTIISYAHVTLLPEPYSENKDKNKWSNQKVVILNSKSYSKNYQIE